MLGRIGAAFRTLAVAGAPLGALLGGATATAWGLGTPALLTAAFFVLSVLALTAVRRDDIPVVAPDDGVTTAHAVRSTRLEWLGQARKKAEVGHERRRP
jgi:hypothetical protein